MRSPFGIFRKHGTILTAGLVVLCMFAFTLSQFLRPEHLPILLGMLAFGAIFYLLGQPSGKGGWYAIAGAMVGLVVISMVVPAFFKPAPAAKTTLGEISEAKLHTMIEQRRNANQFIYKIYRMGFGERPDAQAILASQMRDIARFPPEQRQMFMNLILSRSLPQIEQNQRIWDIGFRHFRFAPLQEPMEVAREATVREWVMSKQADEIGIRVSNLAVTEYLTKASNGQLSREQFTDLRKELHLSEAELFEILRYHIKAHQYELLAYPRR